MNPTTKTDEREQWRARILRALAELDTVPPGMDGATSEETRESDGTSRSTEI
jgi:hypothetical protein